MYRKLIACSLICLFLISGVIKSAYAAAPTLTSDHWSVSLGKPIFNDTKMAKPIPNVSNMYSLIIKNNGDNAYNVRVQVFRDEPDNSQTQLQLVSMHSVIQGGAWEVGKEYTLHNNLPVSVKATIKMLFFDIKPWT
ncbi:hypothetical protein PaeBR_17760 [Paenibacillus sp. BR2-3]|uniref:hypothetical protein n=1 Tax=Paenibacillus sp. BR2-3 TaxID=3048494 RepID=UPI003977B29C